jgi:hypothetical protein
MSKVLNGMNKKIDDVMISKIIRFNHAWKLVKKSLW